MSDTLAIYFNGDDGSASTRPTTPIGIRRPIHELPANVWRLHGSERALQRRDLRGDDVAAARAVDRQGLDTATTLLRLRRRRHELHALAAGVRGHARRASSWLDHELAGGARPAGPRRCTVWDAFAQFGVGAGANGVETPFSVTASFTKPAERTSPPPDTAPTVNIAKPCKVTVQQGATGDFVGIANDTQDGSLTATRMDVELRVRVQIGVGGSFSRNIWTSARTSSRPASTDSGAPDGARRIAVNVTPSPTGITLTRAGRQAERRAPGHPGVDRRSQVSRSTRNNVCVEQRHGVARLLDTGSRQ